MPLRVATLLEAFEVLEDLVLAAEDGAVGADQHRDLDRAGASTHLRALVEEEYGGDAARLWEEAADGDDLRRRIGALPGFGKMKITAFGSVLAKRFGVRAAEGLVPNHPTLGDVDSVDALHEYQAAKRAYKAKLKQA